MSKKEIKKKDSNLNLNVLAPTSLNFGKILTDKIILSEFKLIFI